MNKHGTDSHKLKMGAIIISIFNCLYAYLFYIIIMLVTPCNIYMKLYLKHHYIIMYLMRTICTNFQNCIIVPYAIARFGCDTFKFILLKR